MHLRKRHHVAWPGFLDDETVRSADTVAISASDLLIFALIHAHLPGQKVRVGFLMAFPFRIRTCIDGPARCRLRQISRYLIAFNVANPFASSGGTHSKGMS